MPKDPAIPSTNSRRLLFGNEQAQYQIFTFDQKPDGSIYIASPDFQRTKWLSINPGPPPALEVLDAPGSEKISVHGSGVVHVKCKHTERLRIKGHYLQDTATSSAGVRHVLTCAISEPSHVPVTSRTSDVRIATPDLKPYVFVFWAVPAHQPITVDIAASFHVDDVDPPPPECGFGSFTLRTHAIAWFAYRTKHMDIWPQHAHSAFHDGFHVPIIIGMPDRMQRMELRRPGYSFNSPLLEITV